jgi:hypothetical protein
MHRILLFIFAAGTIGLLGCASESNTDHTYNPNSSYRENNPNAEAGVDTPIWSSNPKKTTVTKRIGDATSE